MTPLQRAERAADQIAASISPSLRAVAEMNPVERIVLARHIDEGTAEDDETYTWNCLSSGEQRTLLMAHLVLRFGELLGHVDVDLRARIREALAELAQAEVTA